MRCKAAIVAAIALIAGPVRADMPVPPPVAAVVDGRLPVGGGMLPIFVSQDWSRPLPGVRRVVITVHGYERNAADYARNMLALAPPADTLVVAPQFLAPEDIAAHQLPDTILRWDREVWAGGDPADGPAPVSAFDALDAILAKLGDRAIFPNLSHIVLAGFSAGGQVVQRYAIVGKGEPALRQIGIRLRYVVGSPSSYAYFSDDRPLPDGGIGPFPGAAACPQFNRWRYGFAGDLPPYVAAAAARGAAELEHRYVERDIVYLVGAGDTNPNHRFLDTSCAGEAQGPTRRARMQFFLAEMKLRGAGAFKQPMWVIDGAAHNAAKVLGSACGRAALFDQAGCPGG
jgi:hypothetical protein